jgi:hypothetical protein
MLALYHVNFRPETWWHDIRPKTRDALLRRGWIREVRHVKCASKRCKHPGYVAITRTGITAMRAEEQRLKSQETR